MSILSRYLPDRIHPVVLEPYATWVENGTRFIAFKNGNTLGFNFTEAGLIQSIGLFYSGDNVFYYEDGKIQLRYVVQLIVANYLTKAQKYIQDVLQAEFNTRTLEQEEYKALLKFREVFLSHEFNFFIIGLKHDSIPECIAVQES